MTRLHSEHDKAQHGEAVQQQPDLERQVEATAERPEPLGPGLFVPEPIRLGEPDDGVGQGAEGKKHETAVIHAGRSPR